MRDMTKENFIYCKYCGAKLKKDYIGKYCGTRNCQWEFGVRYPPNEGLLTPAPVGSCPAGGEHDWPAGAGEIYTGVCQKCGQGR